jgi:hypothetical protein
LSIRSEDILGKGMFHLVTLEDKSWTFQTIIVQDLQSGVKLLLQLT